MKTLRTALSLVLVAGLLFTAGCGLFADDAKAQVEVCADVVVGILNGDAALIESAVPPEIAEENPGLFDEINGLLTEPVEVTREWIDDELVLTVPASDAPYRLWAKTDADEPTVLGELGGEFTSFSVVETDEGWRVDFMDGMDMAELLEALTFAPQSEEEMQAWEDTLLCYTNQLIIETAAEVYATTNGAMPDSMSDLVPDLLEQTDYCPDAASQYSQANSSDGYLPGLGPDATLEPCSVHGHHSESDAF